MSLETRIIALAQAVGLDMKAVRGDNLPTDYVPAGTTKTIPPGYQMPIYGAMSVDGTLDIQGKLVLT